MSEVYAVDIHPAARIGKVGSEIGTRVQGPGLLFCPAAPPTESLTLFGITQGILLDHGTGVVIGETAVIGDNCSLLQV